MYESEREVYHSFYTAIHTTYPTLYVSDSYERQRAVLPLVTLYQMDSSANTSTWESGTGETHEDVTYELCVYSNKINGKKEEAKAIMDTANAIMQGMGFMRKMCNPVPNYDDLGIYRIVARYTATIDFNNSITYRR